MENAWEFTENLNEPVYVTDVDSYELVYMNKKLREMYNICDDSYKNKKCYELIQQCNSPCAMCNNKNLECGKFCEWIYFNPILNKNFSIKDTLIEKNGHRYRMEIAIAIDSEKWNKSIIANKSDYTAIANEALRIALKNDNPDNSLFIILEYLGKILSSERTYIFEKNDHGNDDNTYEWVKAGIEPMKSMLQNVGSDVTGSWYKAFAEDKHILISNIENIKDSTPEIYDLLSKQDIKSLVVVPLYDADKIIGFYGVYNPHVENLEYALTILQVIAHFLVGLIKQRNLIFKLKVEEQNKTTAILQNQMTETLAARTQENLDMINDIIGSGMWTVEFDEDGQMTRIIFSPKFRQLLGFNDENDFPNTADAWKERLHPDEKDEQVKAFWDGVQGKKEYDVIYRARKKDGEYQWFHGHGRAIKYPNGNPRFFLGIFINITEKHKAEQALQDALKAANKANSTKSAFLASMSHDIRTPLNAIIGMTAIAGANITNTEKIQHCLSEITLSSKHLLNLINEVLDMNKIESGKVNLTERPINLSNLIENFISLSKPLVKSKNHDFVANIREIKHENVIGDEDRIQQCLMNFMSNAIKYTPDNGKITLSITEKQTNRPKIGCYEFIFEDNGIGMSEEFIQHIFEPFERADDERVERQQGTGLGMPITQNIIRMMNGTIKVESKLDVGTKITATIFLEFQKSDETFPELINLPVLVVDDNKIACETTSYVLNELGMKCEFVYSGRDAIEKISARHKIQNDYFAIIVDWIMPEMDGVETIRAIRDLIGEEVQIIIMSAYDWSDIEAEAREAGANAFLSKPIFRSKVAHTFLELIGKIDKKIDHNPLENFKKDSFTGTKVLLVEDNEINAEIAEEILGMTGLEVNVAWNGKEAVEALFAVNDNTYKLVFMDIQMPVMDGYEATQIIRKSEREYLKNIPIIAMSANAFAEDVAKSKSVGMNEHIAKPLDFDRLLGILNNYLRK